MACFSNVARSCMFAVTAIKNIKERECKLRRRELRNTVGKGGSIEATIGCGPLSCHPCFADESVDEAVEARSHPWPNLAAMAKVRRDHPTKG